MLLLLSIRAAKLQSALCKTRHFTGQTGNARAENVFAALILIGCRDVKQLRGANEILRILSEILRKFFTKGKTKKVETEKGQAFSTPSALTGIWTAIHRHLLNIVLYSAEP